MRHSGAMARLLACVLLLAGTALPGCQIAARRRPSAALPSATRLDPKSILLVEQTAPSSLAPRQAADGISAATLCPADVQFFVQVDHLLALGQPGRDLAPLSRYLIEQVDSEEGPAIWRQMKENLGLDSRMLIERYLGESVVLVGRKSQDKNALVMLTRVQPEHSRVLPEKLELVPGATMGHFAGYTTSDGKMLLGITDHWLAVAGTEQAEAAQALIERVGSGDSLADNDQFKQAMSLLPGPREAVVFVRDKQRGGKRDGGGHDKAEAPSAGERKGKAVADADAGDADSVEDAAAAGDAGPASDLARRDWHAAVGVPGEHGITIHYAGRLALLPELLDRYSEGDGVDFGPMPANTITAVTLNIFDRQPEHAGFVNLLLFPRRYERDIAPKLAAPVVLFLGKVPPEQITPNPGFNVPVFGLALRMRDPSVANDLDRLMNSVRVLVNLGELDLLAVFFGKRRVNEEDNIYHTADFGKALSRRVDDPQLTPLIELPRLAGLMQITYGPVGDWYVACTQQAFFRQCMEAGADPGKRLTGVDEFPTFRLSNETGLLISSVMRAPQMASLVAEVSAIWRSLRPEDAARFDAKGKSRQPDGFDPKILDKPLAWLAGTLRHHNSFSIQIWHDDHGYLRGKIEIVNE